MAHGISRTTYIIRAIYIYGATGIFFDLFNATDTAYIFGAMRRPFYIFHAMRIDHDIFSISHAIERLVVISHTTRIVNGT